MVPVLGVAEGWAAPLVPPLVAPPLEPPALPPPLPPLLCANAPVALAASIAAVTTEESFCFVFAFDRLLFVYRSRVFCGLVARAIRNGAEYT